MSRNKLFQAVICFILPFVILKSNAQETPSLQIYNERYTAFEKQYRAANPDWPAEEPVPRHIMKKAFSGMTGKEIIEAAREKMEEVEEVYSGLEEDELKFKKILAIEKILEFFPLVETDVNGYKNFIYLISSQHADPVIRLYLIKRSYPSGLPQTLFSLYLQDVLTENRPDITTRYIGIALSKEENAQVQAAVLAAVQSVTYIDFISVLQADREAMRFVKENSVELKPKLYDNKDIRFSADTVKKLDKLIKYADDNCRNLQVHFNAESTRPDFYKEKILKFIEETVKVYSLPGNEEHKKFLSEQK